MTDAIDVLENLKAEQIKHWEEFNLYALTGSEAHRAECELTEGIIQGIEYSIDALKHHQKTHISIARDDVPDGIEDAKPKAGEFWETCSLPAKESPVKINQNRLDVLLKTTELVANKMKEG